MLVNRSVIYDVSDYLSGQARSGLLKWLYRKEDRRAYIDGWYWRLTGLVRSLQVRRAT